MNPSSEEMMAAVYAYNVLTNRDPQSTKYIERYADRVPASVAIKQAAQTVPAASASGESAELTGPYALLMKACLLYTSWTSSSRAALCSMTKP